MDDPQKLQPRKRPADLLTTSPEPSNGQQERPRRPSDMIAPKRLSNRDYRLVMSMVDDVAAGRRQEVGFKLDGSGTLIETSTGKKIL